MGGTNRCSQTQALADASVQRATVNTDATTYICLPYEHFCLNGLTWCTLRTVVSHLEVVAS
eukprot:4721991-Amphidinium_carterae.1